MRLAQLLDNLVSNAIKFTPQGGRVDVRVRERVGSADLEVRDTGMGIPADEQEHLFERFFRASQATEQAIQGTGLGLAISKAIVHAHGGRIAVASEEGEGQTFRVALPIRAGRGQSPHEAERSPHEPSGTPLVLVADDDADILRLVTLRLERDGYEVIVAPATGSGGHRGARARARTSRSSTSRCRSSTATRSPSGYGGTRRRSAMPVILLTARVQEADIARGIEAGADDYV